MDDLVLSDVYKSVKNLMISRPFYGSFLGGVNKKITKEIPTAAVTIDYTKNILLLVNPDFWNKLNSKQKEWLLEHEILHLCFNHLTFHKNFINKELFNVAADMEINQYLESGVMESICEPINVDKYTDVDGNPFPLKSGTKTYYTLLKEKADKDEKELKRYLSEAHFHTWPSDMSDAEINIAKSIIESHISNTYKNVGSSSRGYLPSSLVSIIDEIINRKPIVNWKHELRQFANSKYSEQIKFTRRRESKRYEGGPALKHKRKSSILVAIDTSGSVSNDELIEFLTEIDHINKTGNVISIVCFDASVKEPYLYKGDKKLKITGRGGTDFEPVIEYYDEHNKIYDSCIIFTDGFAPVPRASKKSLTWVITRNCNENFPGKIIKMK